jgi:hypothetical protein
MWSKAKMWKCDPRRKCDNVPNQDFCTISHYVASRHRGLQQAPGLMSYFFQAMSKVTKWVFFATFLKPRYYPAPRPPRLVPKLIRPWCIFALCVESDKMSFFCHVSGDACVESRNDRNTVLVEPLRQNGCSILLWSCGEVGLVCG